MTRWGWLALGALLGLAGDERGTSAWAQGIKVGERHPDFTLPNIADGKPISLSDFRGKKVLLIQFASW